MTHHLFAHFLLVQLLYYFYKKGHPPKDEYFNQLAVSAMKVFDEASKETMGPNSKTKEYDDLNLCYQGSILEMYKQKAQLCDETEIEDLTEMIRASQGMLKDACVQREFWMKRRDEECG